MAISCLLPVSGLAQESIYFVSDRDGNREVYSMGTGGEGQTNLTRHPGRDQAPAVSSDGKQVAWMSDRSGQLGVWLMGADGSDHRLLRELPEADFGLAWSPAGDRLAVTVQQDSGGTHDLAMIDLASRRLIRLTNTPEVEEITPSWSPQGDALYYIAGSGSTSLMRMQVESRKAETVVRDLPSAAFPAVSPDGGAILVRSRTDQFDVLLIDLATKEVENITAHPSNDWGAVWSRDGRSITFASDRDGDMEIYLLEARGGALQKLTDNGNRDWMPAR